MARFGMGIDLKRCVGCNGCTIACKAENGTPKGVFFGRVLEKVSGTFPTTKREFIPMLCNHCEDAPCVKVCPTTATIKRDDGIVTVDNEKCVGCRACYVACPYNNRYFIKSGLLSNGYFGNTLTPYEIKKYKNHVEGTVIKCTFCAHRLEQGLEPACVVTCPTEARIFGDLDDPASKLNEWIRERRAFQLLPECDTNPSVYYAR